MRNTALILVCMALFFLATGCNEHSEKKAGPAANDSTDISLFDSIGYESCYEDFFKGIARFKDSNSAYLLLDDGKRVSLPQFFKDEFMSTVSYYGKKDIDGDGTAELIIFNYTGGAHCCDEYYFFKQKNEEEFEYKAHITGGQACIAANSNRISYSLNELLGYFFSCYACEFTDSSGNFKSMRDIHLKYVDSALEIIPYDNVAEQQNLANLESLTKHGYEKVEDLMDNGWRKEFAMNFAVWYYNHHKNWESTKDLFNKYYKFPDSARVWKEFYRTLREAEKENSF